MARNNRLAVGVLADELEVRETYTEIAKETGIATATYVLTTPTIYVEAGVVTASWGTRKFTRAFRLASIPSVGVFNLIMDSFRTDIQFNGGRSVALALRWSSSVENGVEFTAAGSTLDLDSLQVFEKRFLVP